MGIASSGQPRDPRLGNVDVGPRWPSGGAGRRTSRCRPGGGQGRARRAGQAQRAAQALVVGGEILERGVVEDGEVGVERPGEHVATATHPRDPAEAGRTEALDDGEVVLHRAHHLADRDAGGVAFEPDAAAAAAHRGDDPRAGEPLDDLDEVVAGDGVRLGDLGDGALSARGHAQVEQDAQRVVGVGGVPHGRLVSLRRMDGGSTAGSGSPPSATRGQTGTADASSAGSSRQGSCPRAPGAGAGPVVTHLVPLVPGRFHPASSTEQAPKPGPLSP